MFLQRSSVKNNYCNERIEAKVGVYKCLPKIKTIGYSKLMVNNRYNT